MDIARQTSVDWASFHQEVVFDGMIIRHKKIGTQTSRSRCVRHIKQVQIGDHMPKSKQRVELLVLGETQKYHTKIITITQCLTNNAKHWGLKRNPVFSNICQILLATRFLHHLNDNDFIYYIDKQ
ncbi:Uncharacterized protein FWK35_00016064 [Aphis craccivora]|uniref:Uncharacterized protein n=1 Tax=Aphis craccivora TaxID=307492 RepID=A0A6G0Y2S5_APHCR|nr:Uncharacterized protein FWK35_00016064 [Aphis craccivora]